MNLNGSWVIISWGKHWGKVLIENYTQSNENKLKEFNKTIFDHKKLAM